MRVYQVMVGLRVLGTFDAESQADRFAERHRPYHGIRVQVVPVEVMDAMPIDFILARPGCDICKGRNSYFCDGEFRCLNCY